MTERNWRSIWDSKILEAHHGTELNELLRIAGFSSPFGRLEGTAAWLDYAARQAQAMGLRPEDSLYEVGCGAGAFLYPFHRAGHRVGGNDFAPGMVDAARRAMPDGDFQVLEAAETPQAPMSDVVVSNGVFLYFPDKDYAATVLRRMVAKARRYVGVFDVCDLDRRDEALAARRDAMGAKAYEAAYHGLDHLYLDRQWFAETLADLPVRVETADQCLEGYGNASFRYNVHIYRIAPIAA